MDALAGCEHSFVLPEDARESPFRFRTARRFDRALLSRSAIDASRIARCGLSTGPKTPEGIERMKLLGAGAIEESVKEGVKWLFDKFRKKQEGKRIQGPSELRWNAIVWERSSMSISYGSTSREARNGAYQIE
jgi:hypothetical protein